MGSIVNTRELRNSVNQPRAILPVTLWWQDVPMLRAVEHIEQIEGFEYDVDDKCITDNVFKNIRTKDKNNITIK